MRPLPKGAHAALGAVSRLDFARALVSGLSRPLKAIPCRFFYDERGSELFERITRLPEYYLTRAETAILQAYAAEIASRVPAEAVMVEFGSGSSLKTELLLDRLPRLAAYVPIDISPTALAVAEARLARRRPQLRIVSLLGDFTAAISLPAEFADTLKIGFFPGSTIGNFAPDEALLLLVKMGEALGPGGRLVIGVDLKKDPAILLEAYDDRAGVTAAFNLNLLARANRELNARFDLSQFVHRALYDEEAGRIEMHLESRTSQRVSVLGRVFEFAAGERIHTENSHKYAIEEFRSLADRAGWRSERVWTDPGRLFSVHALARS
jgi:dimethylhistidine N-methyltransferase